MRAYTPISSDMDLGRIDLLVKVYFAGQNPSHPPGGKMSQHLDSVKVGEEVTFKGPVSPLLLFKILFSYLCIGVLCLFIQLVKAHMC